MQEKSKYMNFSEFEDISGEISKEEIFGLNKLFNSEEIQEKISEYEKKLKTRKKNYFKIFSIGIFLIIMVFILNIFSDSDSKSTIIFFMIFVIIFGTLISLFITSFDGVNFFIKREILAKIAEFIDKDLKYFYKSNFVLDDNLKTKLISKKFLKGFNYISKNEDYLQLDIFENLEKISLIGVEFSTGNSKVNKKGYSEIVPVENFYLIKISFENEKKLDLNDEILDKLDKKGFKNLILEQNVFLKKEISGNFFEVTLNLKQEIETKDYLKFYINMKEIYDLSKEIIFHILNKK